MKLTEVKHGDTCRIVNLSGLSKLVQKRLIDLGVIEGVEICCKNAMPFGGPYMLEVCGQCLSLRKRDVMRIEVEGA
ncbi:MAG: FeoA family protein [Bacillota bacterium]|nr:FeoA family protein [Bacillota bacterium]